MGEGEEGGEGEGGIHPHPDIQAVVVLADDASRERERGGEINPLILCITTIFPIHVSGLPHINICWLYLERDNDYSITLYTVPSL